MSVAHYCNREVIVCRRDESAQALAELMRAHHVGDVVVVEVRHGERVPVGIVTDRDLVVGVLAERVSADVLAAADVMSADLVTIPDWEDLTTATALMRRKGIRRVVVTDRAGFLVGTITSDDVLEVLAEELGDLSRVFYREREREMHTRL